tara:strand:- start:144 stop:458 length:315 start_codon:yes stop_codon:yes gene_type:complete
MNNKIEKNGESGQSGGFSVNYGIMEPLIKTKKCKGTGKILPIDNFYYDKRNGRYESYCMKYKNKKMNDVRKSSEVNQLKQNIYNLKYQLKLAKQEIKALKDGVK